LLIASSSSNSSCPARSRAPRAVLIEGHRDHEYAHRTRDNQAGFQRGVQRIAVFARNLFIPRIIFSISNINSIRLAINRRGSAIEHSQIGCTALAR
jgi:hypothetical protein